MSSLDEVKAISRKWICSAGPRSSQVSLATSIRLDLQQQVTWTPLDHPNRRPAFRSGGLPHLPNQRTQVFPLSLLRAGKRGESAGKRASPRRSGGPHLEPWRRCLEQRAVFAWHRAAGEQCLSRWSEATTDGFGVQERQELYGGSTRRKPASTSATLYNLGQPHLTYRSSIRD